MKSAESSTTCCLALVATFLLTTGVHADPADYVFTGGKVYTVNKEQPWAEAVAIQGKKIIFVGSTSDAKRHIGEQTKVVDLDGKMMLPGFVDSHFHPVVGAVVTPGANLQYNSVDEVLKAVKQQADANPDSDLIRGFGWRYASFPATGPTKQMLDEIVSDRPVFLFAIDGHGAWVNSKALNKAGISKDTPDPQPGFSKYQRDPKTGEPTGYLVEVPAVISVLSKLQPLNKNSIAVALDDLMPKFAAAGITAVFDAGIMGISTEDGFGIYFDMEKRGKLTMRIVGSFYHNNPRIDPLPIIKAYRKSLQSELVQCQVLKVNVDGGDAQHTGAYLQPYADKPDTAGTPIFTPKQLNDIVVRADAAGIDVHYHSFGDRATRMSLDSIEAAIKANPKRDRRHALGHSMYVHDDDIPRFAQLNAIAQFAVQWATPDSANLKLAVERLGERVVYTEMIRPRSVLDAGGKVTFGTDWPVAGYYSTYKPLEMIQVALTRKMLNGKGLAPVLPPQDEIVTLPEAIEATTLTCAYQIRLEDKVGSIEVGKLADLVVLEKNLFDVEPMEISKVKVLMTMMNGEVTYRNGL